MSDIVRMKYKKNPLINVIFQLRFPTILKIGANSPEKFQERIMAEYPYYDETIEQVGDVEFSEGNPVPLNRQSKNYQFLSEDEQYKINLTPTFISFSTCAYTQWEDFRTKLDFVINEFEKIYHPLFYSRVGLRYEDAITRSKLGLDNRNWKDLIRPHVLGILAEDSEGDAQSYTSIAEFKNKDQTSTRTHFEFVHVNGDNEVSFLIDCDYFLLGKTELAEMKSVAENLHNHSTNFIRNAITEELHNAMEPEEIKPQNL